MTEDEVDQSGSNAPKTFTFEALRPQQANAPAPCQENCPCGTSVRDWIAPIAQRTRLGLSRNAAYTEAWRRIVDNNPFPAIMGRICPRPCESQCNRSDRDSAVSVGGLERFLGDWALQQGLALPRLESSETPKSFGVIGAGPAGLSYAYQVARRGHQVSVYDWHADPGGMLRYGVPEYRLPREILDAEVDRIAQLGVQFHSGIRVGDNLTLDKLRSRHDFLFLGLGAQQSRRLHVPGEGGPGVWSGAHFLELYNRGHVFVTGEQMVVIGGGNTAIDAARAGRRLGAQVSVVYRRSLSEMPAIEAEITQALEEGVQFLELLAPLEILHAESGQLRGLLVQRMTHGALEADGRHTPQPVCGSSHELPATLIVIAVSQETDWRGLEEIEQSMLTSTCRGSGEGQVSMGGDVLIQGIASSAIAQGREAALVDCGENRPALAEPAHTPRVKAERYPKAPRVEDQQADTIERLSDPGLEVSGTISEAEFLSEAERCLSCGSCLGCYQCWMYCNAGSFTPVENPQPGHYFEFDIDICEGCGKCIELCPCGFLSSV